MHGQESLNSNLHLCWQSTSQDRQKLLATIEAGCGDYEAFNDQASHQLSTQDLVKAKWSFQGESMLAWNDASQLQLDKFATFRFDWLVHSEFDNAPAVNYAHFVLMLKGSSPCFTLGRAHIIRVGFLQHT